MVIPCYNEEKFIGSALHNLADQYSPEDYEIIIVDGMSRDRTREVIAAFKTERPDITVRLIDNPARSIPTAINLGVRTASGNIIARLDAHAVASPNYIRRSVTVLRHEDVGVVGMPCKVCPADDTLMARAIATAVSHPFGIGDAKYRLKTGGTPQEVVDTVAFACFRKALWTELGGFNEMLLTNEDYDFNYRVKLAGKLVVLDRSEHCEYFARSTLAALAKQYSRYGMWKAQMIRLHPLSIKLRHTIAPAFVLSTVLLALLGIIWPIAWLLLALQWVIYLFGAITFAFQASRKAEGGLAMAAVLPLVFSTIHLVWGSSFLVGVFRSGIK